MIGPAISADPAVQAIRGRHAADVDAYTGDDVKALLDEIDRLTAAAADARADEAEACADAIEMNVRNPDFSKQDRGGFISTTAGMAYVAGADKSADIARARASAHRVGTVLEQAHGYRFNHGGCRVCVDATRYALRGLLPVTEPDPKPSV